ncbi:MAG: glycine cleavage system protein H [Candidatus Lokiarchaeota archaeon]|nr:glycine cleavage system protein H [Candidatus Lokiarchaeota archaeon]
MVSIGDFDFPEDRLYSRDHIWVKVEDEGGKIAAMGIDAMGYSIAGQISIIRVKKGGKPAIKGKTFGTMESGKGVVALKSPISGVITDINPLIDQKRYASLIEQPFENWLVKIQYEDAGELAQLIKGVAEISKWAKEELSKMKK